jgi:hypothetical protein
MMPPMARLAARRPLLRVAAEPVDVPVHLATPAILRAAMQHVFALAPVAAAHSAKWTREKARRPAITMAAPEETRTLRAIEVVEVQATRRAMAWNRGWAAHLGWASCAATIWQAQVFFPLVALEAVTVTDQVAQQPVARLAAAVGISSIPARTRLPAVGTSPAACPMESAAETAGLDQSTDHTKSTHQHRS